MPASWPTSTHRCVAVDAELLWSSSHSFVRQEALQRLGRDDLNLSTYSIYNQLHVASVRQLIKLTQSNDNDIREQSLRAILNMTKGTPFHIIPLFDAGLDRYLVNTIASASFSQLSTYIKILTLQSFRNFIKEDLEGFDGLLTSLINECIQAEADIELLTCVVDTMQQLSE